MANLLLSVRHLRDLPVRWGPVFHTSLVLVDPRELPLVIGGDKGQGALWQCRSSRPRLHWPASRR